MAKKLVISYSDDDRDIALKVRDQLAKAGYDIWIALKDIRGAVDWTQSILNAIDSSDGLILVWSELAAKSEDVHEEIRIARVFLKPVFPFLARPMTRVPSLPNEIKTLQVIQMGDFDTNVAELKARLADPERSNIQYPKLAEHGFIPKASNPYFVGRSRELKDLFVDSRGYGGATKKDIPIAISGLAGIGKTQLALAFGYRFNLFFPDGVYWIDAQNGIVHEFDKIGPYLGVERLRDERPYDYAIRVHEKLGRLRNGLIIFDNTTNFSEFREWCPEGITSCSVILTARISPRGFPARVLKLTELDPDSAYEMLITRRNDRAEISHDKAQQEALRELCRITGNHPLALELCASRLQSEFIKPSDYLKDIQPDPLGRLSDEKRSEVSLGLGTTNLSEVLRHSYASLDEEIVDPYFLLMCCFAPHGINQELILQAYEEPIKGGRALDQLANISFIHRELSNMLSLHPLVAQFGRDLQKHKNFDYPGKFVEVMLGFLRAHKNNLAGEDVRREKPHIDEAIRVAQDNKLWEACATLQEYNAGIEVGAQEQIESLQKAYQIIEQYLPQQKRRSLSLRLRLGTAHRMAGQLNDALDDFNQAEVLSREIKNVDAATVASLRFELGTIRLALGRYSEAEKILSDALKVALTALDNSAPEVIQLRQALVEHALYLGDYSAAETGFTEILGHRKKFYSTQPDATSAAALASAHADLSRLALARAHYSDAIRGVNDALTITKQYRKESDPDFSNLYLLLGTIYYESGDYGLAEKQLEKARHDFLASFGEWHPNYARTLIALGEVHRKQARFNKAKEEVERAIKIFEHAYGENHPSVGEALEVQAKIYDHLDELDKEQTTWERIVKIRHQFYSEQHPVLATTHYDYASLFLRKGEYDKAAEHLQSSLRITEQNFGKTHVEYFGRLVRLATCRYEQQEYSRAQETLDEAKSLQNDIFGDSPHPYIARMLQIQSEIQRRLGQFGKAMDYIDQAIAMKETIYGKEHPSVAEALEVKVKIFHHLGEESEAKPLIERALAIRRNIYGENHPQVSNSIHDLGSYYLRLGQYEAAAEQFERARKITASVFNERHPDYVEDTIDLANARYQQSEYQLAYGLEEEVKDALPKGNHYLRARWLQLMSEIQRRLGQFGKAMDYIDQAIAMKETIYGKEHPSVAEALEVKVKIFHHLGEESEAKPLIERALAIRRNIYGENHPQVSNSIHDLGSYYLRLGQYEAAAEQFERARKITASVFNERHPDYVEDTLDLANARYQQGEYQLAYGLEEEVKDALPKGNHYLRARWLQLMSEIQRRLGQFGKAMDYIDQAIAMKETIYGKEHPSVAEALEVKVKIFHHLGEESEAKPLIERALAIRRNIYGENHPQVSNSIHDLGSYYLRLGQYEAAAEQFERARKITASVFNERHPDYVEDTIDLANARYQQSEYQLAYGLEEEVKDALPKGNHYLRARWLQLMSEIQRRLGQFGKAMDYIDQAIAMKETIYGKEHPSVAEALEVKVKIFHHLGEESEAKPLIERALAIRRNIYGENHPQVSNSIHDLGSYYLRLGQYEAAAEQFERARKITASVFNERHPDYVEDTLDLANARYQQGEYQLAYGLEEEVKDALPKGNHYLRARWLQLMSEIQRRLGQFGKAMDYIDQAIAMKETIYGKEHPSVAEALEVKVDFLLSQYRSKDSDEILKILKIIERIRSNAYGESHPQYANYQMRLAGWYEKKDRFNDASEILEQSLQTCLKIFSIEHPETLRRKIELARTARMVNDIDGAESWINDVRETLGARLETEGSPIVAETYRECSYIHRAQGDYQDALAELENALRIETKIFGSESPEVVELQVEKAKLLILFRRLTEADGIIGSALQNAELDLLVFKRLKSDLLDQRGVLLVYKKEYDQAIKSIEEAIKLKKDLLGDDAVDLAPLYIEKAVVLRHLGRHDDALASLAVAHNIDNLHFDENHVFFARILLEQGQTYLGKKSFWEAQEHLKEALQIYNIQTYRNVKEHADAAEALGRNYLENGLLYDASEMFQKALEIRTAIYGSSHPEITETLKNQEKALLKMSEAGETEDLKTRARQKLEQVRNMLRQHGDDNAELASDEPTLADR